MPKHRFRERIKLYFGSHIDPEKDEELKGTKADIEGKVQMILGLLNEEDGRDAKEPLIDLVRDFHTHYRSLYDRYDHLTGYLRKKVNRKQNKDNSSSSSDSDSGSDYSRIKRDSENGELEPELEKVTDVIRKELEKANLEVSELKMKFTSAMEKNEVLQLEYQQALNKLQEADRAIIEINDNAKKQDCERLKLVDENAHLRLKLENACKVEAELNQKLEEIIRERTGIIFEREAALNKIEEGNRSIEDLRTIISQLKDEKGALHQELGALQGEFSTLQQKLDSSEKEIAQLTQAQREAEEENQSLSSKIIQLSDAIKQAEEKIEDLFTESSQLKETLSAKEKEHSIHKEMLESQHKEASIRIKGLEVELDLLHAHKEEIETQKDEFFSLLKSHEDKEKDSSSQIEVLTKTTNNLQLEIESLHTQKSELEEQLGKKDCEISEFSIQIGSLKEELENKNADCQRIVKEKENHILLMKERELELDSINNQKIGLEEQLRDKIQEIVHLQREKTDMQDKIYELEGAVTGKENELSFLRKQSEYRECEVSSQITALTVQATNLQEKIDTLHAQKCDSEVLVEKKIGEISEYLVEIENLKGELESRTVDVQRMLEEKGGLVVRVKDLEDEVKSRGEKIHRLEELIRDEEGGLHSRITETEKTLMEKDQEIVQLQSEKTEVQDKVYELERRITEKESQVSFLCIESEKRDREASSRITVLTEQVNSLQETLDTLHAQKCESEAIVEKKMREISEYLVEVENLKAELASKTLGVQRLLEDKESLILRVNDLEEEVRSHGEHTHKLEEQMRKEEADFHSRATEMEKTLNEKGAEMFALQKKLENVQNGDATQISILAEQIDELKREVDLLQAENVKLEMQLESGKQEYSAHLAQVENQKTELAHKIVDQEMKIKEHEEALRDLGEEHQQQEILFQDCKANLEVAEMKIGEMAEEFQKNFDSKGRKIDVMEEEIEDLKRDLEMKGDELGTLLENVRTTEVKLRLANQKLRVTEQLLNEKEEDHNVKIDKLLQNQRTMAEQITALSRTITVYKETQQRIMTDVSDTVNDTLSGMDMFSMKFEEDWGHLESRIYEILNELKVAKNWIKETSNEKERLKKEIDSLYQQLRDKTDSELVLIEEVRKAERTLQEDEVEKKKLMNTIHKLEEKMETLERIVDQKDKKMGELERKMNEKDKGITDLSEEKREVIRQLCIWIDYHRSRYDHLKETISKMNGGRRQIAAQ